MWPSLVSRDRQPEWMDQPSLDLADHRQALAGLARLNWFSGSSRILWPSLRELALRQSGDSVRVLDLACGGGDVTIALALRAARRGYRLEFVGCDGSEQALSIARENARRAGARVDFFQSDLLNDELPSGFDALISSLFFHHLEVRGAETLLRGMAQQARRLVLVNDLARGRRGYLLAVLASRLLTRSPIVRVDGPLSVRAAFTPEEMRALAARSGLAEAIVTRHWPQRWLLQWWKTNSLASTASLDSLAARPGTP